MCRYQKPAKLAVPIALPLLLLCYGVCNVHCATVHENREDFNSLLEFKRNIISPNNGALSNWNPDTHFCHWNGVYCTLTRPWRVTKLVLPGQGLAGQISSSLGNLTFLEALDLSNNSLFGPVPPLNRLQHLDILYLGSNLLQDVIPDGLTNCSNLAFLNLSDNNLTGVIPPKIGSLTNLVGLNLQRNNLTGTIPSSLGHITTLKLVILAENKLNGTIPDNIWHMQNITWLYLHENSLSGEIPQILPNISSLQNLSLTSNMLSNELPSNIGDALPNLRVLYLGENMFEGNIPASIGNASYLEVIDITNNKFTGQIPSSLGKLPGLEKLVLAGNNLEASESEGWEFFHALANCSLLNILSLANNNLQGTIPDSIANLSTSLTYLLMGGNQLSGVVPISVRKFHRLQGLALDSNNLVGTIEEWIGNLGQLRHLNIKWNNFVGTIPPSIGNLAQLIFFSVAQNKFTGSVPPSLGNLKQMSTLDLSYNNFQGSIPIEFGKLSVLTFLNLSSNKFSGQIPDTLGQLQQIQTIQMDQNILTGNIPATFSKLTTLSMLNLSHNNLAGPLPDYLNDLAESLTKLDLSYNNLKGEVPKYGLFDNATVVSLNDNPGLCGGATDLHLPICHVSRRSERVNYLVKILIPIFGFMSLVLLVYFLFLAKKSRKEYILENTFGQQFEKVTYKDLAQATQEFSESNLIGRGSHGSVYRGKLKESKMEVAVKVFDLEMRGAERSFLAECEALRNIQHRNLLPILTACSTVDNTGDVFRALVYELMPNGNLDRWLHHKGGEEAPKRLSFTQRISIAVNVADALDYLHHDCGRPTVHCDLKPGNILLDDDMNALLGDFGIARFYDDPQSTWAGSISSIGVKGTIGYIAPEYGGGGHASTSGDVYSFGIVLLEILTCKRPTDPMFKDGLDIISFVETSFPEHIFLVIDSHIVEECKNLTQGKNVPQNEIHQCLVDLLQVALSCTRSLPSERSNMKQVASKMHAIKTSHFRWNYKKQE